MLKPFIFVHDNLDNTPIAISADTISYIKYLVGNKSNIYVKSDVNTDILNISCNESPERIYNDLKNITCLNFIKLHDIENNICIVNINDILLSYKNSGRVCIEFKNNTSDSNNNKKIYVKESIETIFENYII